MTSIRRKLLFTLLAALLAAGFSAAAATFFSAQAEFNDFLDAHLRETAESLADSVRSIKKRVTSGGSGVLRDIYTMFLTYHHILPDEVGRQNPWVLFKMLDGLNEDTEDYDNEHLRMFYGEEV